FNGQPEHVINYFFMAAEECREIMASLGIRTMNELVGRVDLLETDDAIQHWKAKGIDLSAMLTLAPKPHENVGTYCQRGQDHGLQYTLDQTTLIPRFRDTIQTGKPVSDTFRIVNTDRATGTTLSHEVSKRWGANGLPDDTIHMKFTGHAGQSLGAWAVHGVTLELEGDANDYVGKGLSGARIIIYPPKAATFKSEENIIIGNVALYGAIHGEAYIRGVAAERFCVRNSGANAVVEGCGDHGLEYMTGGRAVILGATGRNFAAGMSGGVAYVYDPQSQLKANCNPEMVELEKVEADEDIAELKQLISNHATYTGSEVAKRILTSWSAELKHFHKVMPVDYKRALAEMAKETSMKSGKVIATAAGQV
ncbi:MAG: glutamate synthase subunit alpha, partial [Planctomycetia bacterium]|nr:glutamate synthase subunit alpha [Planctomycetia bacterium]